MREIQSAIYIEAQPEEVWRVLTDFPRYAEWNPFIRSVERDELKPGAQLKVTMQLPGGEPMVFRPTLLKVVPASELRWVGKLWFKGVFDGEHAFVIEPHRTGVQFTQREKFSGWLAPLLLVRIRTKTQQAFDEMNRSLKKVVEAKF